MDSAAKERRSPTALEQSRSAADLARTARRLAALLAGQGELTRTFARWLWALTRRLDSGGPAPPSMPNRLDDHLSRSVRYNRSCGERTSSQVETWIAPCVTTAFVEDQSEQGIQAARHA